MELRDYLKILKKHLIFLIIIVVITTGAAIVFSLTRPISYDASVSLIINRTSKEKTKDYKYDGYYAIGAAELFAENVVSWVSGPDTVVAIYKKAGINLDVEDINKLRKIFKAKKLASQAVEVKFNMSNKKDAEKIVDAMTIVLQDKAKKASTDDAAYTIVSADPVIMEHKPNLLLNTLIGISAGFGIGIWLAFMFDYFTKEEKM